MQYLQRTDRNQLFMLSLEEAIDKNAFVRVVDAFVDATNIRRFGFIKVLKQNVCAFFKAIYKQFSAILTASPVFENKNLQKTKPFQMSPKPVWMQKLVYIYI